MAILGRRGSSMGDVRQQAAPAQGLKLTPAQVAKMQQEQSRAIMKQPQQPSGLKAIVQAPATPQQDVATLQAAKVAAAQRQQAVPRTLAPTGASMGVPGMDFRMAKGGMTKKTGYAKGGAVMCGASMPPAQKGKK